MKTKLNLIIIVLILAACQNNKEGKMTHVLKNQNMEIQIDLPLENYNFSRFDWTGKIVAVRYRGILVSGIEKMEPESEAIIGKGFYNEFGIDTPLGFDESKEGEYFHKIGIGLLKKDGADYSFFKEYEIEPATFTVSSEENKIIIECKSKSVNGYSYILNKEIELLESSFVIRYRLQNTGEKTIKTDEYCHNFLSINNELMGSDYILKFPFPLDTATFNAIVNPEEKVEIGGNSFSFNSTPRQQFFFGNLSGGEKVNASWELINTKSKIGISETGSFKTDKINLWGWSHVISPELFFDINVKPGQEIKWKRTFKVFEIE
jgi:hypothetical protein